MGAPMFAQRIYRWIGWPLIPAIFEGHPGRTIPDQNGRKMSHSIRIELSTAVAAVRAKRSYRANIYLIILGVTSKYHRSTYDRLFLSEAVFALVEDNDGMGSSLQ